MPYRDPRGAAGESIGRLRIALLRAHETGRTE